MHTLLKILVVTIVLGFSISGYPKDKNEKGQHKGLETSAEHKSEQGLEHGEAYAGTKEKEEKEEKVKEEKDKGAKDKEKKEKKAKKSKKYK